MGAGPVRDLALLGFLAALLALGLKRPFLFALAYVYVDTVSPHRLSYFLLNSIPLSMIVAVLAVLGWVFGDRMRGFSLTARQGMMALLLVYSFFTTGQADFPIDAWEKWDWAWKALGFAIFLPFTLRSRLRVEALILFLILSASSIIITGGLKTVMSGGGYGVLNLLIDNNSGLYESSTISTVAIALVPLILWAARYGTIFPPDWRVKIFAAGLIFACLLMPIGTEARTGLVCIAVLAVLMLRDAKRRFVYLVTAAAVGFASVPFLPDSFTGRMATIQGYQADSSANVRLAVWGWTWNYVLDHPFGGGFGAYRANRIVVRTVATQESGSIAVVSEQVEADEARAYHSAYFEMLGEQGFPGLILFLMIHGGGLLRMEILRRRYRSEQGETAWIAPLATGLQHFHIIYLVGALFVGIAYQPFSWLVIAAQIGFDNHVGRCHRPEPKKRIGFPGARPQPAGA
jgi:probable O-glycosylation ligase (exosortase A-associated)